jgi:hypothetical protein
VVAGVGLVGRPRGVESLVSRFGGSVDSIRLGSVGNPSLVGVLRF